MESWAMDCAASLLHNDSTEERQERTMLYTPVLFNCVYIEAIASQGSDRVHTVGPLAGSCLTWGAGHEWFIQRWHLTTDA